MQTRPDNLSAFIGRNASGEWRYATYPLGHPEQMSDTLSQPHATEIECAQALRQHLHDRVEAEKAQ